LIYIAGRHATAFIYELLRFHFLPERRRQLHFAAAEGASSLMPPDCHRPLRRCRTLIADIITPPMLDALPFHAADAGDYFRR